MSKVSGGDVLLKLHFYPSHSNLPSGNVIIWSLGGKFVFLLCTTCLTGADFFKLAETEERFFFYYCDSGCKGLSANAVC